MKKTILLILLMAFPAASFAAEQGAAAAAKFNSLGRAAGSKLSAKVPVQKPYGAFSTAGYQLGDRLDLRNMKGSAATVTLSTRGFDKNFVLLKQQYTLVIPGAKWNYEFRISSFGSRLEVKIIPFAGDNKENDPSVYFSLIPVSENGIDAVGLDYDVDMEKKDNPNVSSFGKGFTIAKEL